MKKILNWTFGSVFRTFGRIVAYLLVGFVLFLIIDKSDLKINIRKISLTDLLGIGRVYASTMSWTNKESRLFIDQQGTEVTTSWQTIPYTQSVSYPVTQMQYRLTYSGGLIAGNSYKFKVSYKPTPDALNTSGIWFSDGTETLTEVNCSGWARETNGYYANICNVTLTSDISSSGHLYVRIVFNESYVDSVRSYVGDFEETKGIGAIIQDASIDIMNNQNENTQAIIESNMSCNNIDNTYIETYNKALDGSNGNLVDNSSYGITNYIKLHNSTKIKVLLNHTTSYGICFYNNEKTVIQCKRINSLTNGEELTIPSNSIYFRASINKDINRPQFQICVNGNQATQDAITDDNVSGATKDASDFFSSFSTNTHGLTGIITAPLSAIQSLTSTSCSALELPLPFVNETLTLPCMRDIYVSNFGSFMTLYDTITLGIISYWIMVRIFSLVKDFKNPDHDEIEVMDL